MTSSTTPLQRSRLLLLVHDRLIVGVLMEALACRQRSPCTMRQCDPLNFNSEERNQ